MRSLKPGQSGEYFPAVDVLPGPSTESNKTRKNYDARLPKKRLAMLEALRPMMDTPQNIVHEPPNAGYIGGSLLCLCVSHEIRLGKILTVAEWGGGLGIDSTDVISDHGENLNKVWAQREEGLNLVITQNTSWHSQITVPVAHRSIPRIVIELAYGEVLVTRFIPEGRTFGYLVFIFSFGSIVAWDLPRRYFDVMLNLLDPSLVSKYEVDTHSSVADKYEEMTRLYREEDDLNYFYSTTGEDYVEAQVYTEDLVLEDAGEIQDMSAHLEELNDICNEIYERDNNVRNTRKTAMLPGEVKSDCIRLLHKKDCFERLAYSYAMAQSTKLSVFEESIDISIEVTKSHQESLARDGRINARRQEISCCIGSLFSTRFYVNLHSDILDTPEFFWEHDEFENIYAKTRAYLEIPKRVNILNTRLDIIKDMYDMLNQELLAENGMKLEWIVIYLVFAEVFIEVFWNILLRDCLKVV